ncbi:hypothetical protein Q8W71_15580 [Methylobacterium sp. NEAU 140]|uniref:hypothetical protein n=1 Tax=Methylobacterium sp. NEAU 140 TaxID=3064945 RepID=UPI00273233F0|nr:hypothetical protein [Methylobacterium sp. NEAU 140]MDP4024050.1 hypothetical protein [Methylobacterium sp. NEAU 140]
MPRTAARVTQAHIARAIRAMRAAGVPNVRVRLTEDAVIVEADLRDPEDPEGRRMEDEPEKVFVC